MLAALALAAAALTSTPMPTGAAAPQPTGFLAFCTRMPAQCKPTPNGQTAIVLTSETWLALQTVNQTFNRAIHPMEDQRHYGKAEYWTIPTDGFGDCEDYALAKRQELAKLGYPMQALRMATVIAPDGEAHSLLTVATDQGDLALDNLTDQIKPWAATGYKWIERQNQDGWSWAFIP